MQLHYILNGVEMLGTQVARHHNFIKRSSMQYVRRFQMDNRMSDVLHVSQTVACVVVFLGAVTGSIISGLLVPLGRRWSLQLGCWIFILGGIIGSLALGPFAWIQLMIAR